MSTPDYAIEAIGLEKTYRASGKLPEMRALKGIALKIERATIFGLLGPPALVARRYWGREPRNHDGSVLYADPSA